MRRILCLDANGEKRIFPGKNNPNFSLFLGKERKIIKNEKI